MAHTHVCHRVWGWCKFGTHCRFPQAPFDACLHHLRSSCSFGASCRYGHDTVSYGLAVPALSNGISPAFPQAPAQQQVLPAATFGVGVQTGPGVPVKDFSQCCRLVVAKKTKIVQTNRPSTKCQEMQTAARKHSYTEATFPWSLVTSRATQTRGKGIKGVQTLPVPHVEATTDNPWVSLQDSAPDLSLCAPSRVTVLRARRKRVRRRPRFRDFASLLAVLRAMPAKVDRVVIPPTNLKYEEGEESAPGDI
jgi:hypothetical protein